MKAIRTKYNGVTYRSRLEARWAVVFSESGFDYTYEPEGWRHDGKCYLPDFFVDKWQAYVAIKPRPYDPAMERAIQKELWWQRECFFNGEYLWLIVGDPVANQHRIIVPTVLEDCGRRELNDDEVDIFPSALEAAMACQFGFKAASVSS